jgi:acetylornithine deacetylase/succinyl-diaminopimelate desuccinylase-like protein
MLFVPSINGKSHDITEDTSEDHIVTGARVLLRAVELFAESRRAPLAAV